MSQDKTNRDSIKWYFPPRNPPADLSNEKKILTDYFQPLNHNNSLSQPDVPDILESQISNNLTSHEKNCDAALVDLTVKTSSNNIGRPELSVKNTAETEVDQIDESDQSGIKKRKKMPTINSPATNEISLDVNNLPESSPANKKLKYDSNQVCGESSDSRKNSIPVTRHKTKAFYKQVLPIEPQDLSAKKNPAYNQCSKGIKKYFVSKASSGLKGPRKVSAEYSAKCDKSQNNIHGVNSNQKITPLKKRKSNLLIEETADINNIYGFVDENISIIPRATRFGRKCNITSLEVPSDKPSRSSSRPKMSKQTDKECKNTNISLQSVDSKRKTRSVQHNQKVKTGFSSDSSKPESPKKYSLRLRNTTVSTTDTPKSPPLNVRRSSRLCTSLASLTPPSSPLLSSPVVSENEHPETDFQRALDSLYVTEVVKGDCKGSPIRLKFTRVGQRDSISSPSATDSLVSFKEVPALPSHKKKHSKKKHKKHTRNTNTQKLSQYRAILKKAVGKPSAIVSKIQSNDKESTAGQRSLRQSSILNRKAVEGAQKADQLKRRRWEQQRINSPPKHAPRKKPIQAKPPVVKKILNDSKPVKNTAIDSEKPRRKCAKRILTPKASTNEPEPIKSRPVRNVANKALSKDGSKRKAELKVSQRRISPRKKEAIKCMKEETVDTVKKPELEVKTTVEKKCSVKLAPLFTRTKKNNSEEDVSVIETVANKEFTHTSITLETKVESDLTPPSQGSSTATKDNKDSDSNHSFEVLLPPLTDFKKVNHIQQKADNEKLWQLSCPVIKGLTNIIEMHQKNTDSKSILSITTVNQNKKVFHTPKPLSSLVVIQALKLLEKNSNAIPVKKVFKGYLDYKQFSDHRSLENLNISSTSCDESDAKAEMCNNKVWTQKYKPRKKQEIIGNSSAISTLFNWLMQWKLEAEKDKSNFESKVKATDSSDDDSDFQPDQKQPRKSSNKAIRDEDEDEDFMCNTMLISGAHGIGKTASVYALAEELGFKVFEVNASSKRTGKQVMSQLQEVTQSKQVSNTSKDTSEKQSSNIASFFLKSKEKTSADQEKARESSNQCLTAEATSLLLFEDIDLVFQEDEGFLNAVSNFMSNTKRPIIITTNDKNFSSLNKLKGDYEELELLAPPTDLIAQHLQLIALAENMLIRCEDIETIVKYQCGDIRKCILSLQYGIASGGWNQENAVVHNHQSESDVKETTVDLHQKNMSSDMRFNKEVPSLHAPSNCIQTQLGLPFIKTTGELLDMQLMDLNRTLLQYLENHIDLIQQNGTKLINLPTCQIDTDSSKQVGESQNHAENEERDKFEADHKCERCLLKQAKHCTCNESKKHTPCVVKKILKTYSSFFDNVSACDSLLETVRNGKLGCDHVVAPGLCTDDITDDDSQVWRKDIDILASIQCHNLFCANQCIKRYVNSVHSKDPTTENFKTCKLLTSFDDNQIIVNNSLYDESSLAKHSLQTQNEVGRSGAIPLTSYTNIRSKVLDYIPTIRSICKAESQRSECSNKRSGRFLHYLDSISVEVSSATQQKLMKQLQQTK